MIVNYAIDLLNIFFTNILALLEEIIFITVFLMHLNLSDNRISLSEQLAITIFQTIRENL